MNEVRGKPAPQEGLESLAVNVDNVEEITGFDFFSCLPDDIESEVESQVNYRIWNRRKRVPRCAVCDLASESRLPCHILSVIFIASWPHMRATAIPSSYAAPFFPTVCHEL